MGRNKSPNRDEAFKLFKESGGRLSSAEIAAQLGEKINNVNSWRAQDKWKEKIGKVGAPHENQNAIGNNGGAPRMNQNHYIHGLYSKYFPKQTVDVMKDTVGMAPIDILWMQIHMKFAAIIRSQKIMFVTDKDEMIKELKRSYEKNTSRNTERNSSNSDECEYEYEFQFAWDRQATFLKAQSSAMAQLTKMIKQYDDMLHKDWDLATEEQKLRVEALKLQLQKPELNYTKKINKQKMELARERFEHQKKMDEHKNF